MYLRLSQLYKNTNQTRNVPSWKGDTLALIDHGSSVRSGRCPTIRTVKTYLNHQKSPLSSAGTFLSQAGVERAGKTPMA